jgi:hypothetical protein
MTAIIFHTLLASQTLLASKAGRETRVLVVAWFQVSFHTNIELLKSALNYFINMLTRINIPAIF